MVLNLLDLPEEILEMIFEYCHDDRNSLIKLTEVNKYIKEFVESSSVLMSHIYLDISINLGQLSPDLVEIFEACLKSSRKYSAIEIDHYTDKSHSNVATSQKHMSELLRKHSDTITDAYISLTSYKIKIAEKVLRYLVELPNLDKLRLNFKADDYSEDSDESELSSFDNFESDSHCSDESINDNFNYGDDNDEEIHNIFEEDVDQYPGFESSDSEPNLSDNQVNLVVHLIRV